jgi:hypothetical protein
LTSHFVRKCLDSVWSLLGLKNKRRFKYFANSNNSRLRYWIVSHHRMSMDSKNLE